LNSITLDEEKKLNERYEKYINGLERELNDARLEAARSEGGRIEIDARWKDCARRLLLCLDKLEKLEKKNIALRQCLRIFFILIILLTMELSLITELHSQFMYL